MPLDFVSCVKYPCALNIFSSIQNACDYIDYCCRETLEGRDNELGIRLNFWSVNGYSRAFNSLAIFEWKFIINHVEYALQPILNYISSQNHIKFYIFIIFCTVERGLREFIVEKIECCFIDQSNLFNTNNEHA